VTTLLATAEFQTPRAAWNIPIPGSAAEVTALTKRILQELCGVSPAEALDINYGDK